MTSARHNRIIVPLAMVLLAAELFALAFLAASAWSKVANVLGTLTAIAALFSPRLEKLRITPESLARTAIGMLVGELVVIVVGAVYVVAVVRADLDVMDKLTSTRRFAGLGHAATGRITLDLGSAGADRDRLTIGIGVLDTRPDTGLCTPFTKVHFEATTGGTGVGELNAGSKIMIDRFTGARALTIDFRIVNAHADRNCAVDVVIQTAVLSYA